MRDRRRRASFIVADSCSNYILGDRRRRASFILGERKRRASFILGNRRRGTRFIFMGNSSRKYILGDRRRRTSFIFMGDSSRNYISSNYCIVNILNICAAVQINSIYQ